MGDPTSRLLRLLSLLQTHRHWPASELAGRLGVTTRTIRRDVDRLRALGYPVAAQVGVEGGYRLEAGSEVPPLLLDDDEAVAIALGLQAAAQGVVAGMEEASVRALAKLQQVLPARLRRRVSALHAYTVPLTAVGAPLVDAESLAVLGLACRDREQVRFRYTARDQVTSRRTTEPHRLVSTGNRWYLLAWDVQRADWRTFRVDRLDDVQLTAVRFRQRPLPADDVAAYVREALRAPFPQHDVVVRLHAPLAVMAERVPSWGGALSADGDRTCILRTTTDSLEWTATFLGGLGVELDLVQPEAMRDCLRAIAQRLGRAVAASPP